MKSFLILWCIPLVLGYDAHPFKDCRDSLNSTECLEYEPHCDKLRKVRTLCKRTCGLCPAVSPMSCHSTKHGCCWDNLTVSGENGQGCPACKDKSPYCFKYIDQCHFGHIRRACPIACKVDACKTSAPHCYDEPTQAKFCKVFKDSGFCKFDPQLMVQYCRKTCDLCHKVPEIHAKENVNPPREEAAGKIVEEEVKEETISNLVFPDEEETLQKLLKDSSIILKNKRNQVIKHDADKYLKVIEQLSKKEIENEIDDLIAAEENKVPAAQVPSLPVVAKKQVAERPVPKREVKDAVSSLAKISIVKDELERKTADILNDLIKDTIVQQTGEEDAKKKEADALEIIKAEEIRDDEEAGLPAKKEVRDEKPRKDSNSIDIAKLEASLLDMLLKERTKKSAV